MPDPKPKYFFDDYASHDEWYNKPPLPPPDRPLYVPREWAAHIGIAIACCLNRSEESVDLAAMKQIGRALIELHPGLVDEVVTDGLHYLWVVVAPDVEPGPPPVDCDAGSAPSTSYPAPHPAMPLATSSGGPTMATQRFVPIVFTPSASNYAGERCEGVNLILLDRNTLEAPELGIELASALHKLYPNDFKLEKMSDLLASDAALRSGTPLRGGIRLVERDNLEADTFDRLQNAGVTQPVFRQDGATRVALPEIRIGASGAW